MSQNAFSSAPMDVAPTSDSVTPPVVNQEAIAAILGAFLELVERIAVAAERIADAEEASLEPEEEGEGGMSAGEYRAKTLQMATDFLAKMEAERAAIKAEEEAWFAAHPEGAELAPDVEELVPIDTDLITIKPVVAKKGKK